MLSTVLTRPYNYFDRLACNKPDLEIYFGCKKFFEQKDQTFNWRCSTSSSLTVEYSALVKAVHDVASGNIHSPEGRQSIAEAWSSRKITSEDSNGLLSTAYSHGLSSPDCQRTGTSKTRKTKLNAYIYYQKICSSEKHIFTQVHRIKPFMTYCVVTRMPSPVFL